MTEVPMDGAQLPEADARFEARVEELRDGAFGWFVRLRRALDYNDRGYAEDIAVRILDDGLPCSEDQCETLAREIIEEDG